MKIYLHATPGEIAEHGYSVHDPVAKRRKALREAIREEGHARPVYRHLLVRATQLKTLSPKASKILREDAKWIKQEYYGTKWWPRPGSRI